MVSSESAPPGFIKHVHFTEHPSLGTVDGGGAQEFLARCASVLQSCFIFSATTAEACHFFQWQALTNITQAQSQSCTLPWDAVAPRTLAYRVPLKWADGFSASLSLDPNPHPAQVLLVEGMGSSSMAWLIWAWLQLPLFSYFFSFLKCFFRCKGMGMVSGIKECC